MRSGSGKAAPYWSLNVRIFAIDQSIRHTGLCLLDDLAEQAEPVVLESLDHGEAVGMQRAGQLMARIASVIEQHNPDVVVMEDYAVGVGGKSNNLTRLAEIGGMIKWLCHGYGYHFGYGTGHNIEERTAAWETTRFAKQLFVVQNVKTMKAFCLADGSTSKDTAYLLKVHQRLGKAFRDDDQADAYMHAWMAGIVINVIRGITPIGDLPEFQQIALIRKRLKKVKGLSERKALKLSDDEKMKLVEL